MSSLRARGRAVASRAAFWVQHEPLRAGLGLVRGTALLAAASWRARERVSGGVVACGRFAPAREGAGAALSLLTLWHRPRVPRTFGWLPEGSASSESSRSPPAAANLLAPLRPRAVVDAIDRGRDAGPPPLQRPR